jgi:hypothetical protein
VLTRISSPFCPLFLACLISCPFEDPLFWHRLPRTRVVLPFSFPIFSILFIHPCSTSQSLSSILAKLSAILRLLLLSPFPISVQFLLHRPVHALPREGPAYLLLLFCPHSFSQFPSLSIFPLLHFFRVLQAPFLPIIFCPN